MTVILNIKQLRDKPNSVTARSWYPIIFKYVLNIISVI